MAALDDDHPLAVAYVDLDAGFMLLNNNDRLPITNCLDADGEECTEDDEAAFVIGGSDGQGWWTVDIRGLQPLGAAN